MNPVMSEHGVGVPKENRFFPYTLNGGLVAPVFRHAGGSSHSPKTWTWTRKFG